MMFEENLKRELDVIAADDILKEKAALYIKKRECVRRRKTVQVASLCACAVIVCAVSAAALSGGFGTVEFNERGTADLHADREAPGLESLLPPGDSAIDMMLPEIMPDIAEYHGISILSPSGKLMLGSPENSYRLSDDALGLWLTASMKTEEDVYFDFSCSAGQLKYILPAPMPAYDLPPDGPAEMPSSTEPSYPADLPDSNATQSAIEPDMGTDSIAPSGGASGSSVGSTDAYDPGYTGAPDDPVSSPGVGPQTIKSINGIDLNEPVYSVYWAPDGAEEGTEITLKAFNKQGQMIDEVRCVIRLENGVYKIVQQ